MNVADNVPLWDYGLHVLLLAAMVAAFMAGCIYAGRALDRYIDRKNREADQAIADPVLAAHRGQSTRLVRGHTVPRPLSERNTR